MMLNEAEEAVWGQMLQGLVGLVKEQWHGCNSSAVSRGKGEKSIKIYLYLKNISLNTVKNKWS